MHGQFKDHIIDTAFSENDGYRLVSIENEMKVQIGNLSLKHQGDLKYQDKTTKTSLYLQVGDSNFILNPVA